MMICHRCLARASALSSRISNTLRSSTAIRTISSTHAQRSPPAAPSPSPSPSAPASAPGSESPTFSTPLSDTAAGGEEKPALSSCPEGTILTGLNYFKNRTDPVALADDAYPSWLWTCIETEQKEEEAGEDEGDEFSKSKKQRRLAAKRQRALEAKILAEGNLEALAPKIPLQYQSINLPGNEDGTPEGALAAKEAREALTKAMRKERKKTIKETNYLKGM
ncbi:mitochondrial ribosomal protein L37-domain-containing protein [Annulohypoxylon truncatum]|uniref:mitochondrial ribosomal protein L37-domain-containing protein n=1 Tax=Annulohypoxylon truncatum TaxID=327061 RepID=UPI002007ECB4|nr:mitochondrial ribosomal protein L37-domain-containing protein [Annulohypoxylon truncatum]KAI1213853.1 mitochondrial ribosomal protein L37-domain-containing protein [Annulohypoxylon truncatum]